MARPTKYNPETAGKIIGLVQAGANRTDAAQAAPPRTFAMIPNETKTKTAPEVELTDLSALTPDDRNANKGTQRGTGMLEDSLRKYGAGRSILTDKNGRIIAGNKTAEGAASIGLDEAIVVRTDGNRLVVVQRTDLDLDDPKARELAIADNRTGEINLDWNADELQALIDDGVDLSGMFGLEEIAALKDGESVENPGAVTVLDQAVQLRPPREYIVVMCEDDEDWDALQSRLKLRTVARGGYKPTSPYYDTGIERVITAKRILGELNAGCDSK